MIETTTHRHKWIASTIPGVLAVCSECGEYSSPQSLPEIVKLERRAETAEAEIERLKLELLTLKQDMARKLLGGLAMVWTPEQIVEWAKERRAP